VRWREALEEPPFVKRSFFFLVKSRSKRKERREVEENRVERRRESETLLQSELEHIVIRHS
jgi:hypothetical protein